MSKLTLAPGAIEQIKKFKTDATPNLRVSVVGGGCSGMSYKLELVKETDALVDDNTFDIEGLKVLVDPKSLLFLKGIVIDYVNGLHGSGFTFKNPTAKNNCGCGTSFGV